MRRLRHPRETEQAFVELRGIVFAALGHRRLYVVDSFDRHGGSIAQEVNAGIT